MGITNNKSDSKSSFRMVCCLRPSIKRNEFNGTIDISDNVKSKFATLIQSVFRGYRARKNMRYQLTDYSKLCQIVNDDYSTEKFDKNPKILQLQSLLPPFVLDDREKFFIESTTQTKHVALLYFDGSIFKGYINHNWQREGFGKLYLPGNSIYEGFFRRNYMEGRGRLYSIDGYVYDGYFYNSMFCGFGKLMSLDGLVYRGEWKDDKQNGYGNEQYSDGSNYAGNFVNGKKNGEGTFTWKNGNYYKGSFVDGELTGFGTYRWIDGRIYCGNWLNHKMEGPGLFIWPDKKKYIGNYSNDMKSGFGIFYSSDGKRFEGFWKNGKQNGKGVVINGTNKRTFFEYLEGQKIKALTDEVEIKCVEDEIEKGKKKIDLEKFLRLAREFSDLIKSQDSRSLNSIGKLLTNSTDKEKNGI